MAISLSIRHKSRPREHLLFSDHLTAADFDHPIRETYLGQAHIAGTGPGGASCRECRFWGRKAFKKRDGGGYDEYLKHPGYFGKRHKTHPLEVQHGISAAVDLPWPHKHLSPNARIHWAAKAKATRKARQDAFYASRAAGIGSMSGEAFRVSTTFFPPDRRAYDEDNLKARCKALYDGISDALGVDDKHFRHAPVVIGDPVKGGSVRIVLEVA